MSKSVEGAGGLSDAAKREVEQQVAEAHRIVREKLQKINDEVAAKELKGK
jgi:hypothetical protein